MPTINHLGLAISAKRRERGIPLRVVANELSEIGGRFVTQQSVSTWMKGTVPTEVFHDALATWLGISVNKLREMLGAPATQDAFSSRPRLGVVTDRKAGKFRFDSVPNEEYAIKVDTKVMAPALPVGALAVVGIAQPKVGNEVLAHAAGGRAFIGVWQGDGKLSRYAADDVDIKDAIAIHPILFSQRPA